MENKESIKMKITPNEARINIINILSGRSYVSKQELIKTLTDSICYVNVNVMGSVDATDAIRQELLK